MNKSLISNPPYNLKWSYPVFAQEQHRFCDTPLPPESNANYAFVLNGLNIINKKAVFLLPCDVLSTSNKREKEIRKCLVEKNLVEAVILCPDKMFEKTSISTCIIVFNKEKTTSQISFIDMRETYTIEEREQNGQYGGKSHENRTYKKAIKTFSDEQMEKAIESIKNKAEIPGFSKTVPIKTVQENDYTLTPARYIELQLQECEHRDFSEIVDDINRIIAEKNTCKLTVNVTIAKMLGFDTELYAADSENQQALNELLKNIAGKELIKNNYIVFSKNKNEIKFENNSKEKLSSILRMILSSWEQHIFYLNEEENRYLAELRDALLPELMSGKIDVEKLKGDDIQL